ncbi:MAG: DUF4391 domain-containing protein [Cytophagales bacterium]|nr:DUF4391 domain-containing protein [Cytophagales bacterium]
MAFFNLPDRTKVGRVVPKNAFDAYTNSKQKKLFTDLIKRITWTHKLSQETVNLRAMEVHEIQLFKIELKEQSEIKTVLEVINKAIPYHIVFWVEYNQEVFISTSPKHPHPTNDNIAVIDWTFTSSWFQVHEINYEFILKESLDAVYKDFCIQLTGKPQLYGRSFDNILKNEQDIHRLKKAISDLKSAISKSKQFNEKVEMNIRLKGLEEAISKLD